MNYIAIFLIRLYKKTISPVILLFFGRGCRFTPTCSQYTIDALEVFGFAKGVYLGFKRIIRCNPWGSSGFDPIPTRFKF